MSNFFVKARRLPGTSQVLAAIAAAAACLPVGCQAQDPPAKPALTQPTAPKDVLMDKPQQSAAPASAAGGALVPTPGAATGAVAVESPAARPARAVFSTPLHDSATASVLAELALDLMRQQSVESGNAQVNAVVSPVSLATALGMVHAGTVGPAARELAGLVGSGSAGARVYTSRLPALVGRLGDKGGKPAGFAMANRVWLDKSVVTAVPGTYTSLLGQHYGTDAALLSFTSSTAARQAINAWVSDKTAKRIPELMPEGSITPTTKLVVTNAIHFKRPWAEPFDPSQTAPKPFFLTPGSSKMVPTMVDERQVRMGAVDNISVLELPFAGNEFALMVGMPPEGHSLNAFETDLDGTDLISWSSQLKPTTCRLELPKFSMAPLSRALKTSLEAMGAKTIFTPEADLTPMLGKAAKGVYLDNVFQSATIVIDEQGGEAAAATGGAMQAKSISLPAPACAVNRPFIFAVVHKPTGSPLFVGKVADPSKP